MLATIICFYYCQVQASALGGQGYRDDEDYGPVPKEFTVGHGRQTHRHER